LISINPKYGKPYNAVITANVIILSNHKPRLDRQNHILSRCLWIDMEARDLTVEADPNIHLKFEAEMAQFLAFASWCYARRCKNHAEIVVNDAVNDCIEA